MAVECWDETGQCPHHLLIECGIGYSVTSGETVVDGDGELVCRKPFPSQPTHFWNDDDGIKYTKAYFSLYKGQWINFSWLSLVLYIHTQEYGHMAITAVSTQRQEGSPC